MQFICIAFTEMALCVEGDSWRNSACYKKLDEYYVPNIIASFVWVMQPLLLEEAG